MKPQTNASKCEHLTQWQAVMVIAVLCGLATGCYPAKSVMHYGVRGVLVDASTSVPLARARVAVSDGDDCLRRARTNGQGEFTVAPEYGHFITWLGGPWYMFEGSQKASLGIAVNGYSPYRKDFRFISMPESFGKPGTDFQLLTNNYIVIGNIKMEKTP